MPRKLSTAETAPARNFGELLVQLKEFEGCGIFTSAERTDLRRRQREMTRLRPRRKKVRHAA